MQLIASGVARWHEMSIENDPLRDVCGHSHCEITYANKMINSSGRAAAGVNVDVRRPSSVNYLPAVYTSPHICILQYVD